MSQPLPFPRQESAQVRRRRSTPLRLGLRGDSRVERRPATREWVTSRHLDQSLEKGDVEVIGGMTGATPGCEPTLFNLFVFLGGQFAGTVSPTRMMPFRDGAAAPSESSATTR